MTGVRARGEEIRRYILDHVDASPGTIAKQTAEHFHITRQAVSWYIAQLVKAGLLEAKGTTRSRRYRLRVLEEKQLQVSLTTPLSEDWVWREQVAPLMQRLAPNVIEIWHYGFTEMLNNAIDHSQGNQVITSIRKTAVNTDMVIADDGEGIFNKIQRELGLYDPRHAILELAKGKLTTDPAHHTGEGIFFTSRMFDEFGILSGNLYFSHDQEENWPDWLIENGESPRSGTVVFLKLRNCSSRTTKPVFDEFTAGDDYGFSKTVVPVRLAAHEGEHLISRSQAKRLVARFERFKVVILDFDKVERIGQAFADEIFRVFARAHPDVLIEPINANAEIMKMIWRAEHHE